MTFAFVRVRGRCGIAFAGSSPVLVAVTRSCAGARRACRPRGHRCWVHGGCRVRGRCWVRGVAPGRVLRSVLRFPAALLNKITGRVGSGQPNSYRAKKTKKPAISAIPPWLWRPPWHRHCKPATAIRWRFFKFPPRKTTIAPPFPPFDNTSLTCT